MMAPFPYDLSIWVRAVSSAFFFNSRSLSFFEGFLLLDIVACSFAVWVRTKTEDKTN